MSSEPSNMPSADSTHGDEFNTIDDYEHEENEGQATVSNGNQVRF